MSAVCFCLPPASSSTSMVTSLMFGPSADPCQRPVSSQSKFRIWSPAPAAIRAARPSSDMPATLRTTAA